MGLAFSPAGPDPETRQLIAGSFWSLLLSQSRDLRPFTDHLFRWQLGGDGFMNYRKVGYERGEFFEQIVRVLIEEPDEAFGIRYDPERGYPYDGWFFDGHHGHVVGDERHCPECGGSGKQSIFPVVECCEVCGGSGVVGW